MNNIVVRTLEYKSDSDLYCQINRFMECRFEGATAVQKMKMVQLQVIEEGKAVAYLEPDYTVLQVRFLIDGEELRFPDSPCRTTFMSMEQVRMINEQGELRLCDRAYEVQSVVFSVDTAGVPFVDIEIQ